MRDDFTAEESLELDSICSEVVRGAMSVLLCLAGVLIWTFGGVIWFALTLRPSNARIRAALFCSCLFVAGLGLGYFLSKLLLVGCYWCAEYIGYLMGRV